jgi:hypothetical protein
MNIHINNYEAYFLDYHEGNLSPQEVADLFLFLSLHPELKKTFEDFEHITLEDFSVPVFENKDRLKKNITADNREEYFIRAIEGTLGPAEQLLLAAFLEEHPSFLPEFQLFQKTKLQADPSIVFEDKPVLKQHVPIHDDLLIASLEGLLNKDEQVLLEKQLQKNPVAQKEMKTYLSTKLVADTSVVYPYKQELKRKEKKVIPLYYYAASIAASIILLIGLFFFVDTNRSEDRPTFAEQRQQHTSIANIAKEIQPTADPVAMHPQQPIARPTSLKQVTSTKKQTVNTKSESVVAADTSRLPVKNEQEIKLDPITENTLAFQPNPKKTESLRPVKPVDAADSSNQNNNLARTESMPQTQKQDFVSIKDLLSNKIKEKLLSKDTAHSDKTNSSKKLTGWDIAGIVANRLSNMTGKKFEVKPQFNEDGNLKAYALGVGKLEFSRVK